MNNKMEVVYFQVVAENMTVVVHYYQMLEEEVVGNNVISFPAKRRIPLAAMASVEVFGNDCRDHFRRFVWGEEN